jgi:hypothetical protein
MIFLKNTIKDGIIKCRPLLLQRMEWNKKKPFFQRAFAEAGGFEPPVQFPVRQFSKLVVSATHPHFQCKR